MAIYCEAKFTTFQKTLSIFRAFFTPSVWKAMSSHGADERNM